MRHELFFCVQGRARGSHRDLRAYLKAQPDITTSKSSRSLEYHNPDTDVWAAFEFDPEPEPAVPGGFSSAGLKCSLDYLRPSFTGREVMPIVEAVAKRFDLRVIDPQDEGRPKVARHADLLASWDRRNREITQAHFASGRRMPIMPPAQADALWQYMRDKRAMQIHYSADDVFVPKVMLTCRVDTYAITRTINWANAISMVFPECDDVVLSRLNESTLESTMLGVLDYAKLRSKLAPLLEEIEGPVPGLYVLPPAQKKRAEKVFRELKPKPWKLGGYLMMTMQTFVDFDI